MKRKHKLKKQLENRYIQLKAYKGKNEDDIAKAEQLAESTQKKIDELESQLKGLTVEQLDNAHDIIEQLEVLKKEVSFYQQRANPNDVGTVVTKQDIIDFNKSLYDEQYKIRNETIEKINPLVEQINAIILQANNDMDEVRNKNGDILTDYDFLLSELDGVRMRFYSDNIKPIFFNTK